MFTADKSSDGDEDEWNTETGFACLNDELGILCGDLLNPFEVVATMLIQELG